MGKINKNDVRIIIHRLYKRFLSSFFKFSNHRGIDIMKENWDYLIILDAARYDLFKESVKNFKIQGKLKKVESKGSATPEWLKKNFKKDFYDIIYVSANPFIKHKIDGDKIFYWKNFYQTNEKISRQKIKERNFNFEGRFAFR